MYFIWQVADAYDAKGAVAQCNIWLITRLQEWVAELGHQGVYSQFIQGLDTIKDQQIMATKWGTPDSIRSWLAANGAGDDEAERDLAFQYAYPGTDATAGNPIAQERTYAQCLERVLVEVYNFRGCFLINKDCDDNQDRLLSQKVSAHKDSQKYTCFVSNVRTRELNQRVAQL